MMQGLEATSGRRSCGGARWCGGSKRCLDGEVVAVPSQSAWLWRRSEMEVEETKRGIKVVKAPQGWGMELKWN
jgi:hypothetical protein